MCGSGALTGMGTTAVIRRQIPMDLILALVAYSVVAVGTTTPFSVELQTVVMPILTIVVVAVVFGLFFSKYHHRKNGSTT